MELEQKQLEKIVQILEYFIDKKTLEERYNVKIPNLQNLPDCCESLSDLDQKKGCDANVELKEKLSKILSGQEQGQETKEKIADWIISDWGGISKLKDGTDRAKKVSEILKNSSDEKALEDDVNKLNLSDRIPTISKVLSFISPEKYAICDSRVIFSLNWLLFLSETDNLIKFSELSTRNNIIKSYSLKFLLEKLSLKPETELKQYSDYLDAIRKITAELHRSPKKTSSKDKDWKLYDTEMLLFSLAADLEYGLPFLIRELILNNASKHSINEKLKEILTSKNAL